MTRSGLSWKWLLGNALLVTLALGASLWLITREVERLFNRELAEHLRAEGELLRPLSREQFNTLNPAQWKERTAQLRAAGIQVIALRADGQALYFDQTEWTPALKLLNDPETRTALQQGWGRHIHSVGDAPPLLTVAVRVGESNAPLGVARLAKSAWTWRDNPAFVRTLVATLGLITLLTTIILAIGLRRRWQRLLRRITKTARRLSSGDLSVRADPAESDEFALLAHALNEMREKLATGMETVDRQRRTLESLVHQLREGVIVARADGRVALMNPAAIRLLNLSTNRMGLEKRLVGLAIERCIPQYDLQQMLRPPTDAAPPAASSETFPQSSAAGPSAGDAADLPVVEARLEIDGPAGVTHLLARASDIVLPETESTPGWSLGGRLLVLTDITELARLIQMKTDFVANASHELRTPLSSIRGAVETLLGMDLQTEAAAAKPFLSMIDRQSGRLSAMVSDLLDLARVESSVARFEPQTLRLKEILEELHERFADRLEDKRLRWETNTSACSAPTLTANPHLLRLVLDNLVENAIKFTDRDGQVRITCANGAHTIAGASSAASPRQFSIEVADNGCGIPEEDQERVFERFYQVERSRAGGVQRGTGLGLSIVRHAIAAMQGTVKLQSALGQGTRVTITIPQPLGNN